MAGPTTTGLTALLTGEGWHYVGESGEPAFGTGWANASGTRKLAFRIRETGVVDVQGYVENTSTPSPPGAAFFTLPSGYRPSSDTFQGAVVIQTDDTSDGYISSPLHVTSAGVVSINGIAEDPVFSSATTAYAGVAQYVYIQGFFFLEPSSAP